MKVKSIVESPEGNFEFSAELSPQQHAFLIEYAIRDLVRKGLIPFISSEDEHQIAQVLAFPDNPLEH
jgi:hypothetical protein